jgi:hypothetical protein
MPVTGNPIRTGRNLEREELMATQKNGKESPGAGSQHNDWGHSEGGAAGGNQPGAAASTGGIGHRHRDWGHSDVGNAQSGQGESYQGVMPGEEAGELQTGLGGVESLSTGNAGSMQSEAEPESREKKTGE